MNEMIERSVQKCFSNAILQDVVRNILQNFQKIGDQKINSLQIIALKTFMWEEMKEDIYWKSLFWLIFKDPSNNLKLYLFDDNFSYANNFLKARAQIRKFLNGEYKMEKLFVDLKKGDPEFVLAFLDLLISRCDPTIRVIISRRELIVKVYCLTILELPTDKDFCTFWADKIIRMALSKNAELVNVMIKGEDMETTNQLFPILNDFINSFNWTVPPEGWKKAIEQGTRPVYRNQGYYPARDDYDCYKTSFIKLNKYCEPLEKSYCGFSG